MSNEKEYLNEVKELYTKTNVDLFVKYYTNEFRDESLVNKVRGLKYKKVIDDLLKLIDDSLVGANKIMNIFVDDTTAVKKYLNTYDKELKQIINCSICRCVDCISVCKFSSCGCCTGHSKVISCDKEKYCVVDKDFSIIKIYNKDLGQDITFKILALVENATNDNRYILLQNLEDEEDKQIFKMIESIEDTKYIPIESEEELNTIANIYMEL